MGLKSQELCGLFQKLASKSLKAREHVDGWFEDLCGFGYRYFRDEVRYV